MKKDGREPELHPKGRLVLSTLTVGAFALAGIYTCANGPRGQKEPHAEQKSTRILRIDAPLAKPKLGICIIGPSIDGKVNAVGIEVPAQTRAGLMRYVPLWYEIEGLKNLRTDVPLEQGKTAALTYFTQPTSIDGMILKFYGTNPETKQPILLHAQQLPQAPKQSRTYQ